MARTYTTRQGDMVDLVCLKNYGRTREVTEVVLAANQGLAARGPVLPIGIVVLLPDVAPVSTERKLADLWS